MTSPDPTPAPLRCVLFDHDDTLVSTFPFRAESWEYAVRVMYGRRIDGAAYLRAHLGETAERMALPFAGGNEDEAARLVERYRERYFAVNEQRIVPFAGAVETLARLRASGVRVAVVTSKVGWGAEQELRRCGLAEHVEVVIGADSVCEHKPAPEPLLRALAALGVEPHEALMVGDTGADIGAAHAAGTLSAAALWGAQDAAALRALRPTYELTDIRAVATIVGVA